MKKPRRKRCKWCGRLVLKEDWESGLCSDCMDEYKDMDMIARSYNEEA